MMLPFCSSESPNAVSSFDSFIFKLTESLKLNKILPFPCQFFVFPIPSNTDAQKIFGIDGLPDSVALWDLNRDVPTLPQMHPGLLGLAEAASGQFCWLQIPSGWGLCLLHLSKPSLSLRGPFPWCSELCFRV